MPADATGKARSKLRVKWLSSKTPSLDLLDDHLFDTKTGDSGRVRGSALFFDIAMSLTFTAVEKIS